MMTPIDHNSMMIFGKPFITAKEAALRLGYTQDYIGQLVRKGSINGKLIGRTWYVDLEALEAHKTRKVLRNDSKLPDTKYTAESSPLVPKLVKRPEPSQWDFNPAVVKHALVGYAAAVAIIASGIFIAQDLAPALANRSLNALTQAGEKQEELFASTISAATLPYRQVAASGFFQDVYGGLGIVTDYLANFFTRDTKLATPKYIELSDLEIVRDNLRNELISLVPTSTPLEVSRPQAPSPSVVTYQSAPVNTSLFATREVVKEIYRDFHHQTDRNVDLIPRAIDSFQTSLEESFNTLDLISASSTLTHSTSTSIYSSTLRASQATTTSLFSETASFNTLNLTQLSNGSNILRASRITDTIPTGDFISYWNAAGDTQLFRVDNSGNIYAGGIANSGAITITSIASPQLRVQYDSNNEITTAVSSTGATTLGLIGSTPRLTLMPQVNRTDTLQVIDASSNEVFRIDTTNNLVTFTNSTSTNSTTTNATSTNFYASTNLDAGGMLTFKGDGAVTTESGFSLRRAQSGISGVIQTGGSIFLDFDDDGDSTGGLSIRKQSGTGGVALTVANDLSVAFGGAVSGITSLSTSGNITTSGGQITAGVVGTSGVQIINDGTIGTMDAQSLKLRTSSATRLTIAAGSGDVTFTGALSGITTLTTSGTITAGDTINLGSGASAGILSWAGTSPFLRAASGGSILLQPNNNSGASVTVSGTTFTYGGSFTVTNGFTLSQNQTATAGAVRAFVNAATLTAAANGDDIRATAISPTIAKGAFTGLNYYGVLVNNSAVTGTGTITNAYQLYIDTPPTATNAYAIYVNGGTSALQAVTATTLNTTGTITSTAAVGLDLSNAAAVLRLASSNALEIANSRLKVGNGFNGVTLTGKVGVGLVNETDMAGVAAGSIAMEQNSYLYTTRGGSGAKILIGYDTAAGGNILIDNGDVGVIFGAEAEFGGAITASTLYGGTAASQTLTVRNTSGNANNVGIDIGSVVSSDNGGITFYTAGASVATERMRIMGTSGNVGIGVASPQAKLHVLGANASALAPFTGTGFGNIPNITIANSNGTANNFTGISFSHDEAGSASAGIITQIVSHSTGEGNLIFGTTNSAGTLAERMRITSGGNVGIGTNNPRTKLEVSVGLPTSVPSGTGTTGFTVTDGGSIYGRIGVIDTFTTNGNYPTYIQGGLIDTSTYYNLLLEPNGGNVGIGMTAPNAKLQVNAGNVYVSWSGGQPGVHLSDTETLTAGTYGGMYWATDDTLRLYTHTGGDTLIVNESGYVGLGTAPGNYKVTGVDDPNTARFGVLTIGRSGGEYPSTGYAVRFTGTPNTYTYDVSDYAAMIRYGTSGRIETFTASSGTAGNAISFTAGPYVALAGTSWTSSSDERLKENIETLSVLDRLEGYRAVSFNWKQDGRHDIGVIAQELINIFPEVVVTTEVEGEYWGVNYDRLGALALQAAKELNEKIENLELNIANASTSLTVSTSTPGLLTSVYEAFGATVQNAIVYFKDVVIERLTVGKQEAPAGITLYDKVTGAPYCFEIVNGSPVTTSGVCGSESQPVSSGGGGGGEPTPEPNPEPMASPEPQSTTTEPVATSTEPSIIESEPEPAEPAPSEPEVTESTAEAQI
jgi:hypothetical protein